MPGTPSASPLYPDPPFHYEDAEMLVAMYGLDPERARVLLPRGLEPGGLEACLAIFARYPKTTIGPYDEAVVLVSAEYAGESGFFCPFIYVTTDAAMAAGREVWGFPKKIAEISVERDGASARASLSRKGARATLQATLGDPADPATVEALAGAPIFNEKLIMSVTGKEPALHVVTSTLLELSPKTALAGSGTISFTTGPEDAWGLLAGEGDEVAAFWLVGDAILPAGQVAGSLG
ncbi:MAG: acetoacetate decarboxylase family protein [Acidobacteria bacterium]|nr:acetoacetate decarboxylase family protein [Acidobacteriota bacterium]